MSRFKHFNNKEKFTSCAKSSAKSGDGRTRFWSKIPYQAPQQKKTTDFHFHLVLATVLFVYLWVLVIMYCLDKNGGGGLKFLSPSNSKGIIVSLKKQPHDFKTSGFQYFPKLPALHRSKLRSHSIWLLKPLSTGELSIQNTSRYLNRLTQVSVLIKYFVAAPTQSKLSITGSLSNEVVTMELSQYGDGYCTRVLFFGPVHEVHVEAAVSTNSGFIIIDELLVGLGYFVFDGLDEESCS